MAINFGYIESVIAKIGQERFDEILTAELENRLVVFPCVVIPEVQVRSYPSETQPCIVHDKLSTYRVCERTYDWEGMK